MLSSFGAATAVASAPSSQVAVFLVVRPICVKVVRSGPKSHGRPNSDKAYSTRFIVRAAGMETRHRPILRGFHSGAPDVRNY